MVALLVRAWIEINRFKDVKKINLVALLVRAWIEMFTIGAYSIMRAVALLVRAWIEMLLLHICAVRLPRCPRREGMDLIYIVIKKE